MKISLPLFFHCATFCLLIVMMPAGCKSASTNGELRMVGPMFLETSAKQQFVEIASLDLPGIPRGLATQDKRLYVTMMQQGLAAVDLNNPAQPHLVSTQPICEPHDSQQPHFFYSALADGNRLLISDRQRGIAVYNLDDPWNPRYDYTIPTPARLPIHLVKYRQHYYISGGPDGLLILPENFDQSTTPTLALRQFDHVKQAEPFGKHWLLLADNYDYSVQVLDVADPAHPRLVHAIATGNYCDSIKAMHDCAVALNRGKGMIIFNLKDPSKPTLAAINSRHLSSGKYLERIDSSTVAVAFKTKEKLDVLNFYRITIPAKPTLTASFTTGGDINSLLQYQGYLLIGMTEKDPNQPSQLKHRLIVGQLKNQ